MPNDFPGSSSVSEREYAFVNETIKGRFQSAIGQENVPVESTVNAASVDAPESDGGGEIVTATEELEPSDGLRPAPRRSSRRSASNQRW